MTNNVVETIFKTKGGYNECDHCQSVLSPAAYFVKLMETIEKYIEQPDSVQQLKSRRPDLMEMKLDCDNTNKIKLYLEIVNEIIEKKLKKDFGPNVLTELTTAKYPFNLPANIYLMSIRAYLKKYNISLADIYKTLIPDSDTGAESLGLSPEEYKLITLPVNQQGSESELKELCGIPSDKSLGELKDVDKFNDYVGICHDRLQLILDKYGEETTVSSSDIKVLLDAIGSDKLQLLLNVYSNAGEDLDRLKLLLDDIEQNKLQLFLKDYSEKTGVNFDELELLLNSYVKESGINNNTLEKLIENYNQEKENSDEKRDEKVSLKYLLNNYEKFKDWILELLLDSRKKVEKDHYELELLVKIYRRTTNTVRSKLHKLLNGYSKGNGVSCDRLRLLVNGIDRSKLKRIFDFYKDKSCGTLQNYDEKPDLKLTWDKFKEFTINSLLNAYNKIKNLTNEKKLSISGKEIINLSHISLCFLHRFIRLSNRLNWSYDDLAKTLVVIDKKDIDTDVVKKIAQTKRLEERFQNKKQLLNEILGFYSVGIPNNAYDIITGLDNSDQSVNEIKQFKKLLGLSLKTYPDKEKLYNLLDNLDTSEDENAVEDILSSEDSRIITSQSAAEDHLYKVDSWEQIKDIDKFAISSGIEVSKLKSLAGIYNDINSLEKTNSLDNKVSRTDVAMAVIDNKAIFFGGFENNKPSNKIDIYNTITGKWEEDKTDTCAEKWVHEARKNATAAVIGDKAIFFGGRKDAFTPSGKIDIYDSKSGRWETDASEARENIAVAIVGDQAIFFGGCIDNNEYSAKIDIYDIKSERWKKDVPGASEARENAAVAVIDNKAIFFSGRRGISTASGKIDIYDAKSGEWKSDNVRESRESAAVAVIGDQAIFFGGRINPNNCSSTIDIYDNKSGEWKEVPHACEARENVVTAVVGSKAIFFGGRIDNNKYSAKIDIYDAISREWREAVLPGNEARESATVAVVGKKAIFFGGKKGENQYSSKVDIYNDKTGKWESLDIEIPLKDVVVLVEEGMATFIGRDTSGNMQKYVFNDEDIYSKNELNFSYRFIHLAKKLDWSFDELGKTLIAIDKKELDQDAIKEVIKIKGLQKRFEQPLDDILQFCPGGLLSKIENLPSKLHDEIQELLKNNCSKLKIIINQDVKTHFKLNQDDHLICTLFISFVKGRVEALEENIKSFISFLHKTILLSKLTDISVEDLVQLMLKLRVQKINIDEVERIANINDWFNEQDLSMKSFEEIVNLIEYKTILLGKLEKVSIKELIQLMLSLNIKEINAEKVEDTIKLRDWLDEYNFSIETFDEINNYLSQISEKVPKIKELVEKDEVISRKDFYKAIQKHEHTNIDKKTLDATYDFTEEYINRTRDLESLEKTINRTEVTRVIIGNKIIFFGGKESENQYSANIDIYDVKKEQWEAFKASEARITPVVAKIENKVLFFCGKRGLTEYSQQVDIYDSATGEWKEHTVSEARIRVALAEIDEKVIFFCGYNGNHYSSKIDIYDSVSGEWREDKACEAREDSKVAVISNKKAIFFSGYNFRDPKRRSLYYQFSGKIDVYDATNPDHKKRWSNCEAKEFTKILENYSRGADLDTRSVVIGNKAIFFGSYQTDSGRYASVRVVYDNKDEKVYDTSRNVSAPHKNPSVAKICNRAIFFGGKKSDNEYSSKVEIYDAVSGKWEEKVTDASEPRENAAVAIIDNSKAIFFGGKKGDNEYSSKVDIYDAINGKWKSNVHDISGPRENAAVAVIGDRAIFFGGRKVNNQYSSEADIYDAKADRWSWYVSEVRTNPSIAVIGDKAVFFGGEKYGGRYSSKVDTYDYETKKWKSFDIEIPLSEVEVIIEGNKANFVGKDSSNSIQKYAIGYPTIVDQFIKNINTFTKIGLEKEDIESIIKYGNIFGIEKPWSINMDQVKILLKYKRLEKKFASNTPNFSEYVKWFNDEYQENRIVEKVSKLSKWSKETLERIKKDEDFERCFGNDNNPIDSLLKIELLINMINESGVNGDSLLKLKNLHNIDLENKYNEYEEIAATLRSSVSLEKEDKIIEDLEEKKRDILAKFIMLRNEINSINDLYNLLLIDVEMSGCSRISPLKAALNSMQLYIHRCILGLEKVATVNQDPEKGLSEKMWDLLDNYREWEATRKIALYPENYLNPTLRKSATAEYKVLQNTLMQGNITDEAAAYAYIKYFEDFAQLVNLKVVDTYFTSGKLYIIGRTQAEPYIYYCRVADFKDDQSPHNWLPWERIETQITVKIARIIHAFGKLFVFWLQKTEKEKQIESVSINDSILSVHYIFKKADGSWSAQQKLPNEVSIDGKFESAIRGYFSSRDWNKNQKEMCENWQTKDRNTKVYYFALFPNSEHGEWKTRPVEEAIKYFKEKVEEYNKKIKDEAQESKKINKNFYGMLEVVLSSKEILIVSRENGFHNSKFTLQKDFTSQRASVRYLGDNMKENIEEARQSIENFYEKKKEEDRNIIERQRKEIQEKIDKKQANVNKQKSDSTGLRKEKENKEKSKKALQDEVISIESSITQIKEKRKNLWTKIKSIKIQLDNLQPQQEVLDEQESENFSEEKSLQKAIRYLKQKVAELKQTVENEAKAQLTTIETEVTNLTGEINKLAKERSVEVLKKEKNKLVENIEQHENKINALDTVIKQHEEKAKELEDEISNLQIQKKEIEEGNTEAAIRARHEKLDDKKQKEIDLVTTLISQKNSVKLIEEKEIIDLIGRLYEEAYIKGSEAVLTSGNKLDSTKFSGFYGVYLWEIFFHIPTLIAYFFNQEQEFAKARKWYQYILNLTKKGCGAWQFIPFKTKCGTQDNNDDKCDSKELAGSLDPYTEAHKKKTSFEKYVIMSCVDNLIDWGDMLFSQNSWEAINQATMLYVRAWDLLGNKPKKKKKLSIKTQNICELSNNKYDVCKAEAIILRNVERNTKSRSRTVEKALDTTVYCNYFCTPENKDFISLWERIEDRLYKIRHCLDIKGKRLELPLFQPPIDPRQLVSAAAGGGVIRTSQVGQVPHYRFKYMISYAKSIADTVTQIGSELLSVLEKKDAEALTLFYNKQEGVMANLITTIKEKAAEALKEEAKALGVSLSSAKDRKSHYEKLINDGLSGLEREAISLSSTAVDKRNTASTLRTVAAISHLIPTVFGFSCGAFKPGDAIEVGASVVESEANISDGKASIINTKASYERRAEDWNLQKVMATHDVEQIEYQMSANKINQASAEQDLKAHKESIKQIKEKEEFFKSKFTNQELYSWMKGELARLYFQVYKLALEIAKQAESAYRYEIDNDKTFVQPGHWNSLKQGLLAGQKLKFDLEQMDKEYHDSNERRLEITKVISLKQLDPIALYELKTKGSCKFSFTEKLFDLDFPGHYARKIKDIKITIPAVVGPYENVHASLQQTSNQVVLKSDGAINAIKYLVNPSEEEQPENDLLRVNWKQNQEIAISKGDQDSGLFELSFGDERYLPFEGTGVVSSWELNLPQATNRFNVGTISDVIIHLDYAALNGGKVLSDKVKNLEQLKHYYGNLIINLSSLYPEEWDKFKQDKGKSPELVFKPSAEIFPTYTKKPEIDLEKGHIYIIPRTSEDLAGVKADINGYKINFNELGKVKINTNDNLPEIGNGWKLKVSKLDISKLEEIIVVVPYKAEINWKQS